MRLPGPYEPYGDDITSQTRYRRTLDEASRRERGIVRGMMEIGVPEQRSHSSCGWRALIAQE